MIKLWAEKEFDIHHVIDITEWVQIENSQLTSTNSSKKMVYLNQILNENNGMPPNYVHLIMWFGTQMRRRRRRSTARTMARWVIKSLILHTKVESTLMIDILVGFLTYTFWYTDSKCIDCMTQDLFRFLFKKVDIIWKRKNSMSLENHQFSKL